MNIKLNIFFGLWIFIILAIEIFTVAEELPDIDNSLNELYDKLLQREFTEPISFSNHNIERRQIREPTFRLRYGRSADILSHDRAKRWFGDVDQKPIRSPSLRLRYGRSPDILSNDHMKRWFGDVDQKAIRSPSLRLRYGRSSDILSHDRAKRWFGDVDQKPIRSPSLRLRFGRTDPSIPLHDPKDFIIDDELDTMYNDYMYNRQTQPLTKLLWGRSPIPIPMNFNFEDENETPIQLNALNEIDENNDNDNNLNSIEFDRETRSKIRKPLRLRWGRSPPSEFTTKP